VTEWRNGESFTYEVTPLGPIGRSMSRWSVAPASGGALVRVEMAYQLRFGPLGWLMHRLVMRPKLEKLIPLGLVKLQRHLERAGEATEHGAPTRAAPRAVAGA
jgi:hypothetical protein